MRLSKLCQELETMGLAGTLDGAAEKVTQAVTTFDQLKTILLIEQQKLHPLINL
jgi:hypothetical protein